MSYLKKIGVLAMAWALTGCAATTSHNPNDPFEGFNRTMFQFNDAVDRVALKPAATTYQAVLPSFVQTGIGNFFGNIGDIWTAVNNMLQGKLANGMSDVMRVAVNSTFGLGGLLDIGSEAGLPKHKEDFGQTLGTWGIESGPYVVLPLLGSSTMRDTVALPADMYGDPWGYKDPIKWRRAGTIVRVIDQRAAVLDASDLIEAAALDRYSFIRDAYLQRRESQIREKQSDRWSAKDVLDEAPATTPVTSLPDVAPPKDKTSTNQTAPATLLAPHARVAPEASEAAELPRTVAVVAVVETENPAIDAAQVVQNGFAPRP